MKVWKSKTKRFRGVWTSEVKLKAANRDRMRKVNKLLRLLKEEMVDASVL